MTREEAINEIKSWDFLEGREIEAIHTLIPELTESENERMLQTIIRGFKNWKSNGNMTFNNTKVDDILTHLEKQKELFESGKGLYYYDGEKTTYCGYPAMEENPYDFAMSQQEKQKEHTPAEPELKTPEWVCGGWDDEYMINTIVGRYSLHAEIAKKRGDTHDYNLSKSMENWLRSVVKPLIIEKQKEQNPITESKRLANEVIEYLTRCGYSPVLKDDSKKEHFHIDIPRHKDDFWLSEEYKHCRSVLGEYYMEGDYGCDTYTLYIWRTKKEQKPAELTPLATLLSNYLKNDFEYFATKKWDEKKWNEVMNIQASELLRTAKNELEKEQTAEWSEKYIADVFEKVGLAKIIREQGNDELTNALQDAMLELSKAENTEWSEEDEKMLNLTKTQLRILQSHLSNTHSERMSDMEYSSQLLQIEKCVSWLDIRLNSLRPSWKPSEEQMEAFKNSVEHIQNAYYDDMWELYEQLKKL